MPLTLCRCQAARLANRTCSKVSVEELVSARTLFQLAGWSLLIGGILAAIGTLVGSFNQDPANPLSSVSSLVSLVGIVLILLGVPALYARLAHAIGWLGLIGFAVLYISGLLAGIGGTLMGLIVFPVLAQVSPAFTNGPPPESIVNFFLIAGIFNLVGGVLFGAAIVLARAVERNAAILLIIGTVVGFVGGYVDVPHLGDLGTALLLVALAWMGVTLMMHREVEPTREEMMTQTEHQVRARA